MEFKKILVIQTAFLGDAILATSLLEKLHQRFPQASIDFLVKKGNEGIVLQHPFIRKTITFDKKKNKVSTLLDLLGQIRQEKYDWVINVQRFFSSGFLAAFSGAKVISGFDKNPMSLLFTHKIKHQIANTLSFEQEIYRNQHLIEKHTDSTTLKPKLYPSKADAELASAYQNLPYVCLAPASVWYTKRLPEHKWVQIADGLEEGVVIYLLGGSGDFELCEGIKNHSRHGNMVNLAGKLNFLQSTALIAGAKMNVVNDSAPMHFASATNAPTCAVFCSTVENFGFGPLSDISYVVETEEKLDCKPCGLHGYNACPKGHFKCGNDISVEKIVSIIKKHL